MTSSQPPPTTAIFLERLDRGLAYLDELGLRWRNTRFGEYRRLIQRNIASGQFPWADDPEKDRLDRLYMEGLSQCLQLSETTSALQSNALACSAETAEARLKRVLKGAPMPPDDGQAEIDGTRVASDEPRNILFELALGAALQSDLGFSVEVPPGQKEDLRATLPGLATEFLVECKRPAKHATLESCMVEGWGQLKKRRTEHELGIVAIAVDRLMQFTGKLPLFNDRSEVDAFFRRTLKILDADVKNVARREVAAGLPPQAAIVMLYWSSPMFLLHEGHPWIGRFTVPVLPLTNTEPLHRQIFTALAPRMTLVQ